MTIYNVTKINSITGEETKYGTMCEDDMKLVTRGYAESLPGMYDRKNSKYFFFVDRIPDTF